MTLNLFSREDSSIPIEVEGVTPDWARDKSLSEIERFDVFHGNRKVPLGELFRITGDASDQSMVFEGPLTNVHWIGAHMTSGTIRIAGSVGRHVGSEMRGGHISVEGDTQGWTGVGMRGGVLHVKGNAGNLLGAAYRGSTKGMTGGMIFVEGSAGDEVGLCMRRGLIAVKGGVGDFLGFNMIAGTVLVFGDCGERPGANMRRGTLGLFGAKRPTLLPTFQYASTYRPQFLSLLLKTIRSRGFSFDESLQRSQFDLYHGDLVTVGRGEILFRNAG